MDNYIFEFGLGVWNSLFLLILIYLIKEIVRLIIENQINKRKSKNEIQYKYAEKLLDKNVPVYIDHYSFLKQSIGNYIHIIKNYMQLKNKDDDVYNNLENDKTINFKDKNNLYESRLSYRVCENLSYFINEVETFQLKAMNILVFNQLLINNDLIDKFVKINDLIDKETGKLMNVKKKLEDNWNMCDEQFLNLYDNEMSKINSETFIKEINHYLGAVKKEFYREYNVDNQKDYINLNTTKRQNPYIKAILASIITFTVIWIILNINFLVTKVINLFTKYTSFFIALIVAIPVSIITYFWNRKKEKNKKTNK